MVNFIKFVLKLFISFFILFVILHGYCGLALLEQHDWNVKETYETLKYFKNDMQNED